MPGVMGLEKGAFKCCKSLKYIECGKLEIIGQQAFSTCESLSSIDLPSVKIVDGYAFGCCKILANIKFGKELKSIGGRAFLNCSSLERIPLPLKDGIITDDDIFKQCYKLNHIDLVEGVHETIAALLLDEWKNDMNEEIDSINRILLNTHSGSDCYTDVGEKAQAIRTWIRSVHRKIIQYKAEHRRYLNEAAATLQPALPNDILFKNVLPFLELPSYTFDGED
jgi:hypothetical protein